MKLAIVVLFFFLTSCAFKTPPVEPLFEGSRTNSEVTTVQLASHPAKREGQLIFEKIDGKTINEYDSLKKKGYYFKNTFDFVTPVVIQLLPGKHNFIVRYQFIRLESYSSTQATIATKPCLQQLSFEGKPGVLYFVDWKPDSSDCPKLVVSEEPFSEIHAR